MTENEFWAYVLSAGIIIFAFLFVIAFVAFIASIIRGPRNKIGRNFEYVYPENNSDGGYGREDLSNPSMWETELNFRQNLTKKMEMLEYLGSRHEAYKDEKGNVLYHAKSEVFHPDNPNADEDGLKRDIEEMCKWHTKQFGYVDYDVNRMPVLHTPYMSEEEEQLLGKYGQWKHKDQDEYIAYKEEVLNQYPSQKPQNYDADGYCDKYGRAVDWNNYDPRDLN